MKCVDAESWGHGLARAENRAGLESDSSGGLYRRQKKRKRSNIGNPVSGAKGKERHSSDRVVICPVFQKGDRAQVAMCHWDGGLRGRQIK